MAPERENQSVMIVSASEKAARYITELLPKEQYSPVCVVASVGEAKRMLVENSFDIIAVNTPLPDEFGTRFATELAVSTSSSLLLFVKAELYEQVSFQAEEYGIFTLSRPTNRDAVRQAFKMLSAARARLRIFEKKTESLEAKMAEIRLVNRAKLLLMENLGMSEQDAHRFIEKSAMDSCRKKSDVAENIIRTYE